MREAALSEFKENVFQLISKDWILITAGTPERYNAMTASWGGLGHIWSRDVAYVFVRPTRYTYQFMEQYDRFTLSFFDKEYKKALSFCGTKSGREVDKFAATGLTPSRTAPVYPEQARLVLFCRKIYVSDITPAGMIDKTLDDFYQNDYHRMYIGEIERCLVKE